MQRFTRRAAALAGLALAASLHAPTASAQSNPYIGQIMCGGWNFAPRGWALMNGQLMSIAQNTALFALLGTTYGGDGRSTFGLPDMRGRVLMHVGQGPGLSDRVLGEQSGTEQNTLVVANLPPHAHSVAPLGSNNDATSVSPAGKVPAAKARTTLYTDPTNLVSEAPTTTSATGSGVPVNNMPPYLTFTCVIATEGVFPSRP